MKQNKHVQSSDSGCVLLFSASIIDLSRPVPAQTKKSVDGSSREFGDHSKAVLPTEVLTLGGPP